MADIFDKDTLLDLTVNVIPLGIILFFVVVFLVVDPFSGLGAYGQVLSMGLLVVPFVALAILTYVSGKAIAGDEKRAEVFFQGQATMEGAQTRHEAEAEVEGEGEQSANDAEARTDADLGVDDGRGDDEAAGTEDPDAESEAADGDGGAANTDDGAAGEAEATDEP